MLSLGHGDTVDGGNLIKSINIDDNHRIYISLIIIIMDIYIYYIILWTYDGYLVGGFNHREKYEFVNGKEYPI